MKLVLVGTSGYHPNDRRETACLMLPELGVVLDAGTAVYRLSEYLRTPTLDIFLTHAHLDHIVGLTYLLDVLHGRTMERVTIHGSPATLTAIDEHLLHPALFPIKLPYLYQPLASATPLPGGGTLRAFPVLHPGGALGFRLDWPDRSMAYVTDTTAAPGAAYADEIAGVDLLVHECYFSDGHEELAGVTGHSCVTPVAKLAREANVGRLILTHVNPLPAADNPLDLATAQSIFPNTTLAHDRLEVEF